MTEKPANTSVSFQQPLNPQMALQQLAIQQRMAMAQKLMDQSQQPEGTEMVGGGNGVNQIAVPNSKLGGLAKMLGQAIGTNQYYGAQKDAAQMQGQYMQQVMDLAQGGGQGRAGTGATVGSSSPGGGMNPAARETALAMMGYPEVAKIIQGNNPVTNNMADAMASGQPNPQALAKAMEVDKQGAAVGRFTVNGRPDVPMTNEQAMAAAIPGAPPQPMPIANMQGAPVSGPQFTDNNVQYVPPAGAAGPAMGPALSAMPNPPAAQAVVNGTPFVPDTPAQAIGMGPAQGVPGSPPPGSGAPPMPPMPAMPPQPAPMQAPVIGGQTPPEAEATKAIGAGQTEAQKNYQAYINGNNGMVSAGAKNVQFQNDEEDMAKFFTPGSGEKELAQAAAAAERMGAPQGLVNAIAHGDKNAVPAVQAFTSMQSMHGAEQALEMMKGGGNGPPRIAASVLDDFTKRLADPNQQAGAIKAIGAVARQLYKADYEEQQDRFAEQALPADKRPDPLTFQERYAQKIYPKMMAGRSSDPSQAVTQGNAPVQVSSEAEAHALPKGTKIILNGRTGTVQ